VVPSSELPYRLQYLGVRHRAQLVFDPPLEIGEVLVTGWQDGMVLQDCAKMVDVSACGPVLVQAVVGEGSGAISEGA